MFRAPQRALMGEMLYPVESCLLTVVCAFPYLRPACVLAVLAGFEGVFTRDQGK